jgi:hypothetical protein
MDDDARSVVSSANYSEGGTLLSRSGASINKLSRKISGLLCHEEEVSSREHLEASTHLQSLMMNLSSSRDVPKSAQINLMCTLSSLLRRVVRMKDDANPSQSAIFDTQDFERTLTLVFVAIVSIDIAARDGRPADPEAAERSLAELGKGCHWEALCKRSKRKAVADEVTDEFERKRIELDELVDRAFQSNSESASWSHHLASPSAMASSTLQCASWLVFRSNPSDLTRLHGLAFEFARSTVSQMHSQLLRGDEEGRVCGSSDEFLTLGTRDLLQATNDSDREEAMMGIISAGESESGQTIIRDLVVSFLAPKSVVGVRRELLLGRETAEVVSVNYPWIAALAHGAAMAGAEHLWKHSKSELKRACALLAGLAVLTTSGAGEDMTRKERAFGGLVQLPFLETAPPEDALFLALVPSRRSWVIYEVAETGKPNVKLSQRGFEGLTSCVLGIRDNIFKK